MMEDEGSACQATAIEHSDYTPLWELTFNQRSEDCLILPQLRARAVSPQWPCETAAIQPAQTANGRGQMPDSLLHKARGQNILIPPCARMSGYALNRITLQNTIKHSSTSPKQTKSPHRWHSPPLTVTKMKIKCRKSRHHTKDLFSFPLFFFCSES